MELSFLPSKLDNYFSSRGFVSVHRKKIQKNKLKFPLPILHIQFNLRFDTVDKCHHVWDRFKIPGKGYGKGKCQLGFEENLLTKNTAHTARYSGK